MQQPHFAPQVSNPAVEDKQTNKEKSRRQTNQQRKKPKTNTSIAGIREHKPSHHLSRLCSFFVSSAGCRRQMEAHKTLQDKEEAQKKEERKQERPEENGRSPKRGGKKVASPRKREVVTGA